MSHADRTVSKTTATVCTTVKFAKVFEYRRPTAHRTFQSNDRVDFCADFFVRFGILLRLHAENDAKTRVFKYYFKWSEVKIALQIYPNAFKHLHQHIFGRHFYERVYRLPGQKNDCKLMKKTSFSTLNFSFFKRMEKF